MSTETKKPTFALITNRVQGDSHYERAIWEGAQSATRALGARLITVAGGIPEPQKGGGIKASFLFDVASSSAIDGFLVNSTIMGNDIGHEGLLTLFRGFGSRPIVSISHELEGYGLVAVDNESGMRAVIEHLVSGLGKRRVAYVSGPLSNPEAVARLQAYRSVMKDQGLGVDENLIYEGTWLTPSGAQAIQHWQKNKVPFDAVAAANDLMAFGVLSELAKQGITVPGIPVTGFDDDPEAMFSAPQLTTVAQPVFGLGESGIHLLAEAVKNKRPAGKKLLPAVPVYRGSAPFVQRSQSANGQLPQGTSALLERVEEVIGREPTHWSDELPHLFRAALAGDSSRLAAFLGTVRQGTPPQLGSLENLLRRLKPLFSAYLRGEPEEILGTSAFHEVERALAESRLALAFRQAKANDTLIINLLRVNQVLNQTKSIADLSRSLAQALALTEVSGVQVVLLDNDPSQARVVAQRGGLDSEKMGRNFLAKAFTFQGLSGLPDLSIVRPLQVEESPLGFVLFDVCEAEPLVYEAVGDQLSIVVNSLLLLAQVRGAEAAAAAKALEIRQLVLPMLETINESEKRAHTQSESIDELVGAKKETTAQLVATESLVGGMKKQVSNVIDLIATIDDLSETISVIAINAAIAAARAGSDGKVFTVIATEIRHLSVETKANTSKITGVLTQLNQSAEGFFRANVQTKGLFQQVDEDIRSLSSSFEFLQVAMHELTQKAQTVLTTMG